MTLQKIEFEYDIPEGYRFVRLGSPKKNELFINSFGDIVTSGYNLASYWVIVEKIPEQESKKHRWHDLMIEFANDKTLRFECRDPSTGSWFDAADNPSFFEDFEYRKKPTKKTVRFRNFIDTEGYPGISMNDFIPDNKWLGDWQEVEI